MAVLGSLFRLEGHWLEGEREVLFSLWGLGKRKRKGKKNPSSIGIWSVWCCCCCCWTLKPSRRKGPARVSLNFGQGVIMQSTKTMVEHSIMWGNFYSYRLMGICIQYNDYCLCLYLLLYSSLSFACYNTGSRKSRPVQLVSFIFPQSTFKYVNALKQFAMLFSCYANCDKCILLNQMQSMGIVTFMPLFAVIIPRYYAVHHPLSAKSW